MTLHAIGAHFTYTDMPLGNWLRDGLNLRRNHYDRAVHFTFVLLVAYPFREVLVRAGGLHGVWSYVLPVHVVRIRKWLSGTSLFLRRIQRLPQLWRSAVFLG